MNRHETFWRRSAGVTLIEVLVSLALLGSLAVAMVLARGRLVDQHRLALQKAQAVQVADGLLAHWLAQGKEEFPIDASGRVESHDDWVWQTRQVPLPELDPFNAQVVRLTIMDTGVPGKPVELTSVDVVVPGRDGDAQ